MIRPKFYYILSLLFVFVIPAVVAAYFAVDRISFFGIFSFVLGITVLGSIWDIWATRHGKKDRVWLWQFNKEDTLGVKVLDVPIEEYLFYMASSAYILIIWENYKFALESGSASVYVLLLFLGVWSLTFILVPYAVRIKGDKLR